MAGEDLGKLANVVVGVSAIRRAIGSKTKGAVRPKLEESDRKELHVFARKVFIGEGVEEAVAIDVEPSLVLQRGEPVAHQGAPVDEAEDVSVVGKGVGVEQILVVARCVGAVVDVVVSPGDNDNLLEGKSHFLSKLVGGIDHHLPEGASGGRDE